MTDADIAAMCVGKGRLSHGQAERIANRQRRKGRASSAYHCPVCRAWHVGEAYRIRRAG